MARAGQRASPANTNTRVHIRDQNTGLQNSYTTEFSIVEETVQHLASRRLHILKSSRQLRLDFNLAHMPCLACLNCVCADACVSECLHVVEIMEWCKSRWFWIFPACSSAPVHPWGGPMCSWESHGSISDDILRVTTAASVTLRTATPD